MPLRQIRTLSLMTSKRLTFSLILLLSCAFIGIPFWSSHATSDADGDDLLIPTRSVPSIARDPENIAKVLSGIITEANAAWWGFDPQDSTEYLQAAIDSGVPRLIVPNLGTDWIVTPIYLRSDLELIFEEGVVVSAKKGEFLGTNDSLISAWDAENLTIRGYGATLKMNKPDYTQPPYTRAEWRHGLSIRGGQNVRVLGLTIKDTGGDGIYLGTGRARRHNEDIVIRDVVADNNHRQGISIITARNLLIEYSTFKNTGGTPPMAGLDFEPNGPGEIAQNIIIRHNRCLDNEHAGIIISLSRLTSDSEPVSFTIENNVITGNTYGIAFYNSGEDSVAGEARFQHNVIEDISQHGILLAHRPSNVLKLTFANNLLRNVASSSISSPIFLDANDQTMDNIEFLNMVVVDDKYRPALLRRNLLSTLPSLGKPKTFLR